MVEAAYTDGSIDIEEIEKIKSVLVDSFKEDRVEVENILNKSINNKNNSKSLFYYTSKICYSRISYYCRSCSSQQDHISTNISLID